MNVEFIVAVVTAGVVALVVSWRLAKTTGELATRRQDHELELAKLKSGWYAQMQSNKAAKKAEKKPKKRDENAEDDEEDDVDRLVDAMRPFQSLVKGYAQARRLPIDVDRLFDGDQVEHDKVGIWLEEQLRKGGPALGNGAGPRDYFSDYQPTP